MHLCVSPGAFYYLMSVFSFLQLRKKGSWMPHAFMNSFALRLSVQSLGLVHFNAAAGEACILFCPAETWIFP